MSLLVKPFLSAKGKEGAKMSRRFYTKHAKANVNMDKKKEKLKTAKRGNSFGDSQLKLN